MTDSFFRLFAILIVSALFFGSCEEGDEGSENQNNDQAEEGQFTDTTLTDIDGNVYDIIKIGDQYWMAENLKTTTYNDETPIQLETDNSSWSNLTKGAYSWYDNDSASYSDKYGALYNWYAVETEKLCPEGWHVPTNEEWKTMTDFIVQEGYSNSIATALKDTTAWDKDGEDFGTDKFGFTAMPAGKRRGSDGVFGNIGYDGYWWTATNFTSSDALGKTILYDNSNVYGYDYNKRNGFSVRCVRD